MAKEATAIAVAPQVDLNSLVQSSIDATAKYVRIILLGAPKAGKTTATMTISEFCPEALPAAQMTDLKDGLLIQCDSGGHDSLKPLNLSVPLIDLSRMTNEQELANGMNAAAKIAKQRVEAGVTKFIGVDLSTLDKMLKTAIMVRLQKWDLFDAILQYHMRFFQALQALPVHLIFNCHAKGLSEAASTSQADQRTATALPGGATISIDLTGQSLAYYRAQCSLILPLIANKVGKSQTERWLYPNGHLGFEAGSRFPLADKEPAHLGKLLKKIRS